MLYTEAVSVSFLLATMRKVPLNEDETVGI